MDIEKAVSTSRFLLLCNGILQNSLRSPTSSHPSSRDARSLNSAASTPAT